MLGKLLTHFFENVIWDDETDYIIIDLPPGTGDVPLDIHSFVPDAKMVLVTTPHPNASHVALKAGLGAKEMGHQVIGVVENMSYFECPDCKKRYEIFGKSTVNETAEEFGINVIAKIPIDTRLVNAADKGAIELFEGDWLEGIADVLENA